MPPAEPTPPSLPPTQTLYSILNLPTPTPHSARSQTLTTSQIKAAYRRALLKYHPDKTHPAHEPRNAPYSSTPHINNVYPTTSRPRPIAAIPSIDAITYARDILSNPAHRRTYDKQLLTSRHATSAEFAGQNQGDAVSYSETIDLDDMDFEQRLGGSEGEEGEGVWRWGCRCGNEEGFVLSEGELLVAAEGGRDGGGEVVVGCRGCSLVVRVLFCAVDEDEPEEEEDKEEEGEGTQGVIHSEETGLATENTGLRNSVTGTATATTV